MSSNSDIPHKSSLGTEESLVKFINNLDDCFELLELIFDKQGNVVDFVFLAVNQAYERQTGLKAANLMGKRKKEVAPASEQKWYDYAIQAAKTGKTLKYQYYNPKVNGYFETRFMPISTNQIAVLFKDITDREITEEALGESLRRNQELLRESNTQKEELETIFDSLPSQGWYKDKNDRIIKVNKAFADYMHMSKKDLEGKQLCDFFPPDIVKKCWADDKEVIETGQPKKEILDCYETAEGVNWFSTQKVPYKDKDGNIVGTISFSANITERKKAEEALRESEEKLKIYLEGSPAAIFVANRDGRFLYVNEAAGKLLGYSREEFLNMHVLDVSFEGERNINRERFNQLRKTGKAFGELRFKRKDGSPVFVILNATKLPDGSMIANCENISERKKMEKQLQDQERLASIGATAGMVGHDIRNPLQAIVSDTFLLRSELASLSECKPKEGIVESLDSIDKNVSYINKIIQDLQDYAKPVAPVVEEIDFEHLIEDILTKKAIPENINASFDIQADARRVIADPSLLKRILTNLVNNAVQAMPNGGKLTIRTYKDRAHIVLSVEDSGSGIPEEIKHRIFTPLFTTKPKGQGFGLAVVKRMTEALGGTVSFESEEGKGTTFTVSLPLLKS
jgi:PAS domain S-box-containing protein